MKRRCKKKASYFLADCLMILKVGLKLKVERYGRWMRKNFLKIIGFLLGLLLIIYRYEIRSFFGKHMDDPAGFFLLLIGLFLVFYPLYGAVERLYSRISLKAWIYVCLAILAFMAFCAFILEGMWKPLVIVILLMMALLFALRHFRFFESLEGRCKKGGDKCK